SSSLSATSPSAGQGSTPIGETGGVDDAEEGSEDKGLGVEQLSVPVDRDMMNVLNVDEEAEERARMDSVVGSREEVCDCVNRARMEEAATQLVGPAH
ncbi:hypothetical protein H0H87_011171, partial [Tephrocybe sp. NHM501043]